MLQRHQLIRWGRLSGYLMMLTAVVLFTGAMLTNYLINSMLKDQFDTLALKYENLLNTAKGEDAVREIAIINLQYTQSIQSSILEGMQASTYLMVAAGFIALGTSLVYFRSRELAIQIEGINQSCQEKQQTEQVTTHNR